MSQTQDHLPLPNPQDWLDMGQTLAQLRVSRATIYVMMADGRLGDYKIGTTRLFWRAEVVELAEALRMVRKPR